VKTAKSARSTVKMASLVAVCKSLSPHIYNQQICNLFGHLELKIWTFRQLDKLVEGDLVAMATTTPVLSRVAPAC